MLTTPPRNFDEREWIRRIREILDEDREEETKVPVTIFVVPKPLMEINPNSYIPQLVAIGPYNHLRPELFNMERYKVTATKRNQKEHPEGFKTEQLVDKLMEHEMRIRASYQRPIGYGYEALAWLMAVDASFLFEFLQVCGVRFNGIDAQILTKNPSRCGHLVDLSRNKTAHNALMRDIMMLENQIPFFVMEMQIEFQCLSLEVANDMLLDMLTGICKELSPFYTDEPHKTDLEDCAHLLDFLYQFIVPKFKVAKAEVIEIHVDYDDEAKPDHEENVDVAELSYFQKLVKRILAILWKMERGPIQWIKGVICSKPVKVILNLPWTIIMKIPIINKLKEPIENMFVVFRIVDLKKDDDGESGSSMNKPPVLEQIKMPSVTQLVDAGIKIVPFRGGLTSINFDTNTRTFYMPIMELDENTEVVLQNLVAYEACSAPGPMILTRFTELMNSIIDTDEDVNILQQRGIIVNHLRSEKEAANLWNGMCGSVKLTKVPLLDKVIGDVNKFYYRRWKAKCDKFMKKNVFGSWKILTFLATVVLLLLTVLDSFCQVYSCSRIFGPKPGGDINL